MDIFKQGEEPEVSREKKWMEDLNPKQKGPSSIWTQDLLLEKT